MKKKVEQKKQIVRILKPSFFWQYTSPSESKQIDQFLLTYTNELKALFQPQLSLQQNYAILCDKIGHTVHPCLDKKEKEQSNFPNLKNNDFNHKHLSLMNHKIDSITLKLLLFLNSSFRLESIKMTNNQLYRQNEDVRRFFEKDDALKSIYFQWNPLLQMESRQELYLLLVRPTLQHLFLRQCKIGDKICLQLLKKLKQINGLKSVDLYGNCLTSAIGEDIKEFVENNKTLQFLGLSKNQLNSKQFISLICNSIGEVPLTQKDEEQLKQKQKLREQINERNKKRKKGTPQQPLPNILEVKVTEKGRCFVKNMSLRSLNLASNDIKDLAAPVLKQFLQNQGRGIEVLLEGNKFSKNERIKFQGYKNVII